MSGAEIIVFNVDFFDSFQKCPEFYKAVAADARVWSATVAVFAFKIIENFFFINVFYVDYVVFNIVGLAEFLTFFDVFFFARAKTGLS